MGVYGLELRERVLAAYERHGNKSFVCREFAIARTTLDDWLRWHAEGRLKPVVWSRGRRSTIQDWAGFRGFVAQATFSTVEELQALYQSHYGERLGRSTCYEALKRIGYTHKKRL